jgi:LEA14-like dessication related protein
MQLCRRRWLMLMSATSATGALTACAGMPGVDPPRVTIVGLEPLPGEGLEMRFAVKLRIQNPNNTDFSYDGVVLDLDVNGRPLASGVSDAKGSIVRYGTTLLTVPVSVHAIGIIRQLLGLAAAASSLPELPYSARGRLGGGWPGGTRFVAEGVLKLPQ